MIKRRTIGRFSTLLLVVVTAVTLVSGLVTAPKASADPGGRAESNGYFSNKNYQVCAGEFNCGRVLGDGIDGNTSKADFEKYIIGLHKGNRGSDDALGADFIIQMMRGKPYDHNRVSAADLSDWEDRLEDPNLKLSVDDVSFGGWNSARAKGQGASDEIFFPDPGHANSLVFKYKGDTVFKIKLDCGNVIDDLSGLPEPQKDWKLKGDTDANKTSVYAGDTVKFTSSITNDNEGGTADFCYGPRYFYSDTKTPKTPYNTNYDEKSVGSNICRTLDPGNTYGPNGNTDATVTVAASGKYICGTIAFSPKNSDGDDFGRSTAACVLINNPTGACSGVTFNPGSPESNQTFTATGSVDYGSATDAKNVYDNGGRLYMKIYGPSPASTVVFSGAAGRASPQGVSGTAINGTFTVTGGLGSGRYWVEYGVSGPAGATSCGGMTKNNPSQACTDPRDSNCNSTPLVIGDKPYFEVLGGDVAAGAGYGDSCTQDLTAGIDAANQGAAGSYKGSATNLAVFSLTHISGFASGTLGETGSNTTNALAQPNGLAFANTTPQPGSFGSLGCVPDYAKDAVDTTAIIDSTTTDINPAALATGTYVYNAAGPVTVESGVIPAGRNITLVIKGSVIIKGSGITYGAYSSISQAPRFNLITTGDSLMISHTVTILSGFYAAEGGTIMTCVNDSNAESIDPAVCSNPLTINGAVSANTIRFDRTFGSINSTGPAEKIIFSPELWGAGLVGCDSGSQTCPNDYDSITSLPPVL